MMDEITIASTTETDFGWEFEVSVDSHIYRVTLTNGYYFQLTGGKITPQELVKQSFEFLLAREPASSILGQFDLKLINTYFPEYEKELIGLNS